ncbi:hypothetical protein ACIBO5_30750 [Nonomuraea angiospora]|uniref:hypothetical protein n=1 Tax=Nonomuraea angiospora TaxID=46172 RepID=UPI00378D062C
MSAPVPLRGSAAAVAYLLATARATGTRVSRTKLSHLLYLADLRAVEQGLPAGSGLEWRWNPGGPRSFRRVEVERDLREAGVRENERPLGIAVGLSAGDDHHGTSLVVDHSFFLREET